MSTNIIKINRGDSCSFDVKIYDNEGNKHLLSPYEAVYFSLMNPNQRFENGIIIQGYNLDDQDVETGKIKIELKPRKTRCLAPGVYYYTVKLQRGGTLEAINDFDNPEEVRTIIERTKFIVNE